MTGVTQVFSEPTTEATRYVQDSMRLLCHRGGPHCGGTADEQRTPVAAVHVRQGDSCDRHSDTVTLTLTLALTLTLTRTLTRTLTLTLRYELNGSMWEVPVVLGPAPIGSLAKGFGVVLFAIKCATS